MQNEEKYKIKEDQESISISSISTIMFQIIVFRVYDSNIDMNNQYSKIQAVLYKIKIA